VRLSLHLNGESREVEARPDESLLEVLRRDLGLLTVRETCGIGVCGTCTVLLDGDPVTSCILLAPLAEGREITTVEGLSDDDAVPRAFIVAHAFQCGWCTPGMVLTAKRFLEEVADPTEEEIRVAMSGNLCRCGSYLKIIDAVRGAAAAQRKEEGGASG
jgi:aerobic-type carbon monoxide dehydrogenase small subunit (CoxS/CutS family)